MNERIKELDKQAKLWVIDNSNFPISSPIPAGYTEKFAELIIKDIIAGQRGLAKIMSDTGSGDQAYILRITASNIERKYGVE